MSNSKIFITAALSFLFAALPGCAAPQAPSTPVATAAENKPEEKPKAPSVPGMDMSAPFPGIPLPDVPAEFINKWPEKEEQAFQQRARELLAFVGAKQQPGKYGGTFFENEKRSYALAMLDFLNGRRDQAISFLESEDADAGSWNKVTDGIDFYAAFTLKHQGRKYFQLGPYLHPEYRERMKNAAHTWTEQDPLRRPHPYFKKGGDGWTPETKNSWVDVRNTDNLRAMREVNVYLFAEDTGNEETRKIYKERLAASVRRLYEVGLGEWDSENYFGHTTTSFLNLYDFAKDPEVRSLSKAALDWFMVAAALKYYHGAWPAPNKRDYGGASRVFGSNAPRFYQIYFGDNPLPNSDPELDVVHAIMSRYRPPLVAMALAHKQFDPVELFEAKPSYDNWSAKASPETWETMFYGKTFQMGSVASKGANGDVGPFKLGTFNSKRGVDFFVANTMSTVNHQGKNAGDQIGQNRNLLIWLRPTDDKPFYFLLPRDAALQKEDGVLFWKMEKTFLALRPIGLSDFAEEPIVNDKKEPNAAYADAIQYKAAINGAGYGGFALEVGEGDYEKWKNAVKAKGTLDLNLLSEGVAKLTGSDGRTLRVDHNKTNDLPLVHRNGVERKWSEENAVYQTIGEKSLVSQNWGGKVLAAQAGGYKFSSGFDENGKFSWSEQKQP
jgi:hypothetical protein